MRRRSAIRVQLAGACSPTSAAARVALRNAVAATPLVNTPSLTPLLYSSGPATLRIE
jgi:hypothetical protein